MSALTEWLVMAAVGLGALASVWFSGRRSGAKDAEARADAAYRKAREKMDEVAVGDDPAVARDWLRERGKRRGGL